MVYDDDDDDDDDDDGQPLTVSWVYAVFDVERAVFMLHIGHVEHLKHPKQVFAWTDTDDVVIPYQVDHATTSIWISELITRNEKDHDYANKPRLSVGRSSLRPWVTLQVSSRRSSPARSCQWTSPRRLVLVGPVLAGGGGAGAGGYFNTMCIYIYIYIIYL